MDMNEIKNKLGNEKKSLADLEVKKKKLEEKILAKKKKIDEYSNLIQCKQYTDIDNQLDNLGLSREALLMALKNNDLLSLQEAIENQSKVEQPKTDTLLEAIRKDCRKTLLQNFVVALPKFKYSLYPLKNFIRMWAVTSERL